MLAVIVVTVVVLAIAVLFLYDPVRKEKSGRQQPQAPEPRLAPLAPQPVNDWPQRPVVSAGDAPAPQEYGDEAEGGDDKARLRALCKDLRSLLSGERSEGYQALLARDGFFRHRSGVFFTIYHASDVFVVVRATTRTSNTVERLVVSRSGPASVKYLKESRINPQGNTAGIAAKQACNTDTAGAVDCPVGELGFVIGEIAKSARGGDFEP